MIAERNRLVWHYVQQILGCLESQLGRQLLHGNKRMGCAGINAYMNHAHNAINSRVYNIAGTLNDGVDGSDKRDQLRCARRYSTG